LTGSWPVATLKRRIAQKCLLKSYRAVKSALIEPDLISRLRWAWNTGVVPGYVPRGRKADDGRIDDRYNLIELSTSSYPARTKRNIEESLSSHARGEGRDQGEGAGARSLRHPVAGFPLYDGFDSLPKIFWILVRLSMSCRPSLGDHRILNPYYHWQHI
jgi:Circularly permutated YpsA SLOG family